MDTLLNLADEYKLLVHIFDKLKDKLNHFNIEKYRKLTSEGVIEMTKTSTPKTNSRMHKSLHSLQTLLPHIPSTISNSRRNSCLLTEPKI